MQMDSAAHRQAQINLTTAQIGAFLWSEQKVIKGLACPERINFAHSLHPHDCLPCEALKYQPDNYLL
jgi:hypothetical protein